MSYLRTLSYIGGSSKKNRRSKRKRRIQRRLMKLEQNPGGVELLDCTSFGSAAPSVSASPEPE